MKEREMPTRSPNEREREVVHRMQWDFKRDRGRAVDSLYEREGVKSCSYG